MAGSLPRDEKERRILRTMELIAQFQHKHQIKAALKVEYGYGHRRAGDYIRLAQERFRAQLQDSVDDHRAKSLDLYRSIALDRNEKAFVRIKAQEQVDKLLGLRVPVPTEISGPGGGTIKFSLEQGLEVIEEAEQELARKAIPVVSKAIPHQLEDAELAELLKELPDRNAMPGAGHGSEAGA